MAVCACSDELASEAPDAKVAFADVVDELVFVAKLDTGADSCRFDVVGNTVERVDKTEVRAETIIVVGIDITEAVEIVTKDVVVARIAV